MGSIWTDMPWVFSEKSGVRLFSTITEFWRDRHGVAELSQKRHSTSSLYAASDRQGWRIPDEI